MLQSETHPHSILSSSHLRREKCTRERNTHGQDLHGRKVREQDVRLNTLDEVLAFAHTYSVEIRSDAKARRIYRTFAALTNNQFEALLAFSLWKVRGHFPLP